MKQRWTLDQKSLSESNVKAIEGLDGLISEALYQHSEDKAEDLLLLRQTVFMALPTHTMDVSHAHHRGCPQRRLAIDTSVSHLIKDFPHLDKKTLGAFFGEVRANCYLPRPKRTQLYLWGAPGTGKTLFAQRAAEALGLPFLPLALSAGDLSLATGGTPLYGRHKNDPEKEERALVGALPIALAEAGVLNPVFFCDESAAMLRDGSSRESLKKLLDPSRSGVKLAHLCNFEVDLSRVTFIFAGNEPIRDPALATRLKQVEFGPLLREHKERVIGDLIEHEMDNHLGIGDEKVAALKEAMQRYKAVILEIDAKHEVPGVRTAIEVTKETIHFVNLTTENPLCRELSVEEFIENSFMSRQVVKC